ARESTNDDSQPSLQQSRFTDDSSRISTFFSDFFNFNFFSDNTESSPTTTSSLYKEHPCPASLVNYQGKLYMSLVGSSNKVYLTSSLDGKDWRAPYLLSESWRSFKSVSLVVTNDELDT
ncbi:11616_t:CDS:1, partial [Entrophospora sp. SA101]